MKIHDFDEFCFINLTIQLVNDIQLNIYYNFINFCKLKNFLKKNIKKH